MNWVWQCTLLNKSDNILRVTVTFKLIDKDNFVISSSIEENSVNKCSEITIEGAGSIPIYELNRVYDRTWNINYY